jgi:hypothetical protein
VDGLREVGWRQDVDQAGPVYAGAAALRFLVGTLGFLIRGLDDRGRAGDGADVLSSEGRAAAAGMFGCSYEELQQHWSATRTLLAALGREALQELN